MKANSKEAKSTAKYGLPYAIAVKGVDDTTSKELSMSVARLLCTTIGKELTVASNFIAELGLPKAAILKGSFGKGAEDVYSFEIPVADILKVKSALEVLVNFRKNANVKQIAGKPRETVRKAAKQIVKRDFSGLL